MASEIVLELCEACDEEKPEAEGQWQVTDRTYVDHMQVSEERSFVCNNCIESFEDMAVERALEARWWNGYDEWEARNR